MPDHDYPYLEKALSGFHQARDVIKGAGDSIQPLGYLGDKFDFYRFVNRFRLAVNFRGVVIEDFQDHTEETYGALTKLFLMWSTFEMYCHLCGKPYHQMFHYYPKRHTHDLANNYWDYDRDGLLIDFLIDSTQLHGQDHFLKQFNDGNNLRVITVGACIRHIYAHGHLTAHPQGMQSEDMRTICDLFTDFISSFIRADFKRRLALAGS